MFYVVEYPKSAEYAEAALIDVEYDYSKYIHCPQCGRIVSGAYWKKPREVVLTKRKCPDFLYNYCDSTAFLLSENAYNKIKAYGLTGIRCAEAIESIRFQRQAKTKNVVIPSYYRIELARSRVTIDRTKSDIVYGKKRDTRCCSLCRQVPATLNFIRSLSLDTSAYEGYDIFQTYELGDSIILSQRFVDFYKENALSNLHFRLADKYGLDIATYFLNDHEDR